MSLYVVWVWLSLGAAQDEWYDVPKIPATTPLGSASLSQSLFDVAGVRGVGDVAVWPGEGAGV